MNIRLLTGFVCLLMAISGWAQQRTLNVAARPGPGSVQQPTSDERRVGLVIGNASYPGANRLTNPINDANAISRALEQNGFEVHRVNDLLSSQVDGLKKTLEQRLTRNAVLFIYYAGHGVQVDGRNYLLPIDVRTDNDYLLDDALYLGDLLAIIDKKRPKLSVVILDACRDNPFRDSRHLPLRAGLARVDPPSSTVVFYATRPGGVASDGPDGNGLFTTALLGELGRPGQSLEVIFRRTATGVFDQSRGEQEPWIEGVIRHEFFFDGPTRRPSAPQSIAATAVGITPAVSVHSTAAPVAAQEPSTESMPGTALDKQSSVSRIKVLLDQENNLDSTMFACDGDQCLPYAKWAERLGDEGRLDEIKMLFSKTLRSGPVDLCSFDLQQNKCIDDKLTVTTINPLAFLQPKRSINKVEISDVSSTASGGVNFSATAKVFRGTTPIDCKASDGRIEFLNQRVDFNMSRTVCSGFLSLPVSAKIDFNVLLFDYKNREMLVRWDLLAFSFLMVSGGGGIAKVSF